MSTLVQSHWLERRVGARGSHWAGIRAALAGMIPIVVNGDETCVDEQGLALLADTFQFDELARHFPTRGNSSALKRIARFGSQLIAIACAAAGLGSEFPLLVEGALFNLGVALFDTVVDDQPSRLPAVTAALNPRRIRDHLLLGVPLPASADAAVELIVRLFRALFESIRNRVPATRLPALAASLTKMYQAEVDDPAAALDAKILPTAFFGELVGDDDGRGVAVMKRLGVFVALLDDWQDLGSDIVARRPNSFLGGGVPTTNPRYFAACVGRILGGSISHMEIGCRLATPLHAALAVARDANDECAAAMALLLGELLDDKRSR